MPGALTRQGEPAGAPLAAVLIVLAVLGFVVALNVTSTTPGDEPVTAAAGARAARADGASGGDAAAADRAVAGTDERVAATGSPVGLSPVTALPRLTVAARRRPARHAPHRSAARPRVAEPRPVVTAAPTPAVTAVAPRPAPAATSAPRPAPAATVAPRPAPVRTAAPRPAQPDFDSSGGFDSSG